MKYFFLLIGAILLLSPTWSTAQNDWAGNYGTADNENPTRIKRYGDHIYLSSLRYKSQEGMFASFSKINASDGSLDWAVELEVESAFTDFVRDEASGDFLLVGGIEPLGNSLSEGFEKSMICRITDTGFSVLIQSFDNPGKEVFRKIVLHPEPIDTEHPYYVVGSFVPNPRRPDIEAPTLYNFNASITPNWQRVYLESSGTILNNFYGLIPTAEGSLLLTGTNGATGAGQISRVNGNGGVLGSNEYLEAITWHDGIQTGEEVVLVGTNDAQNSGVALVIDADNLGPVDDLLESDAALFFTEIGIDDHHLGSQTFQLYTVGPNSIDSDADHVIHQLLYTPGSQLQLGYTRFLSVEGIKIMEPHLDIRPGNPRLALADAREYPGNAPFGQRELLVSDVAVTLTGECADSVGAVTKTYEVAKAALDVKQLDEESMYQPPVIDFIDPNQQQLVICGSTGDTCQLELSTIALEINCLEVTFNPDLLGTPPFSYNWFFESGTPETSTAENPTVTYPAYGGYDYVVVVSDAEGCETRLDGTFELITDLAPDCENRTIPVDDDCLAIIEVPTELTDGCGVTFTFSCTVTGGAVEIAPGLYEAGVGNYFVSCSYEDGSGSGYRCDYNVEVTDDSPPLIECPQDITVVTNICSPGEIVNWEEPLASDNCPPVELTSNYQSGDEFPTGTTVVTYTATDPNGNSASCSFNVTVVEDCFIDLITETNCVDGNPGEITFEISGLDLAASNGSFCSYELSTNQSGVTVTVSDVITMADGTFTISGTLEFGSLPLPSVAFLLLKADCVCEDRVERSCRESVIINVPCCSGVELLPTEVCKNTRTTYWNVPDCSQFPAGTTINWYLHPVPCPPMGSWGEPYLVTSSCEDVLLTPYLYDDDVCLYATVELPGGSSNGCEVLMSNVVTINVCDAPQISATGQSACVRDGDSYDPGPLTVQIPAEYDCGYSVEWRFGEQPVGTGLAYDPPAVTAQFEDEQCRQLISYQALVTTPCGVETVDANIVLSNEDATAGTLTLDSPNTLPVCYGGDALIKFNPGLCSGDTWVWQRVENGTWVDIPGVGSQTLDFLTNRLFASVAYRVRGTNGSCEVYSNAVKLSVLPEFELEFTAEHVPACAPTGVLLTAELSPDLALYHNPNSGFDCDYLVTFFRNGLELITLTTKGGTITHLFETEEVTELAGNFLVEVTSTCCTIEDNFAVVVLEEPINAEVAGPCFRCLNSSDPFLVVGELENAPPGLQCTYTWYFNEQLLEGETGLTLDISVCDFTGSTFNAPHLITWVATCEDGCDYRAEYELYNCGNPACLTDGDIKFTLLEGEVSPNPATGETTLSLAEAVDFAELKLFGPNGQPVRTYPSAGLQDRFQLDLKGFRTGAYRLRGLTREQEVLIITVIIK